MGGSSLASSPKPALVELMSPGHRRFPRACQPSQAGLPSNSPCEAEKCASTGQLQLPVGHPESLGQLMIWLRPQQRGSGIASGASKSFAPPWGPALAVGCGHGSASNHAALSSTGLGLEAAGRPLPTPQVRGCCHWRPEAGGRQPPLISKAGGRQPWPPPGLEGRVKCERGPCRKLEALGGCCPWQETIHEP